ncbi:hypothetical protein, partial, partial [Absidia glauca]
MQVSGASEWEKLHKTGPSVYQAAAPSTFYYYSQ